MKYETRNTEEKNDNRFLIDDLFITFKPQRYSTEKRNNFQH